MASAQLRKVQEVLSSYPKGWETVSDVGYFCNDIYKLSLSNSKKCISTAYDRTNANIQDDALKVSFLELLSFASGSFREKLLPDIYLFCKNLLDDFLAVHTPQNMTQEQYMAHALWEIQKPTLLAPNKYDEKNYDGQLVKISFETLLQVETEFAKKEMLPVLENEKGPCLCLGGMDLDLLRRYGCLED